jgi:tRNA (cmo5U34)-methyltransferase
MCTLPPTDSGFDRVARIYDILAFLVFGRTLQKAQMAFLNHIPAHSSVLIIGGGSGWLLKELLKSVSVARIVYVEASAKMLSLAQQKIQSFPTITQVDFRLGNETAILPTDVFDAVITPFFLDLFTQQRLQEVIMPHLSGSLRIGGIWLFTDFVSSKYFYHQLLLKMMYWFFGKVCQIEAQQLPDYATLFTHYSFQQKASRPFYGGMMEACVWKTTHKKRSKPTFCLVCQQINSINCQIFCF